MKSFITGTLFAILATTTLAAPIADIETTSIPKSFCKSQGNVDLGLHYNVYIGYKYTSVAFCDSVHAKVEKFGMEAWECVKAADGNTWLKFTLGYELAEPYRSSDFDKVLNDIYPRANVTCGFM